MSTLHVYRNKSDHDFTLLLNLIPGIIFVMVLLVFLLIRGSDQVLGTSVSIDNQAAATENLIK